MRARRLNPKAMHICHMTTVHPARDARIFYRMCRALAQRKVQVTLIAPESFAEEPFLRPSPWNVRLGEASRPNRIALALKGALETDADVFHFHDPELIPAGLALKTLRPAKAVVYDVHEDYPSMMQDKYWLPRRLRPAAAAGAAIANHVAARVFDGVVVADPGVEGDFKKIRSARTLVYYNFPSASFADATPQNRAPVDLVYIGGLSARAGIFVLLEALEILKRDGIEPRARLAGYTDGADGLARLHEAMALRGLARQIEFDGRIPHAEVPGWIKTGKIGLVLLDSLPKFMKNIPSKLFEYWVCGLPVIASDLPPVRQFLRAGENGHLFAPGNARALGGKIRRLLEHPEEGKRLGVAGREDVLRRWNNETQIDRLLSFYESLCHRTLVRNKAQVEVRPKVEAGMPGPQP